MTRLSIVPVVVAAASLVSAQPYAFAHRTHLELKLECARCHPAIPAATRPDRDRMFSPDACGECHGKAILDLRPAPQSTVVKFSHKGHAELGNVAPVILAAIRDGRYPGAVDDQLRRDLETSNACTACHRGLARSDEVTSAALPRMADCLVCHSNADPPRSCLKCHATPQPASQ